MIVLEAEDQVGGIAKTDVRDGYRFDLGGHRFFTKVKEVDDLWHEVMGEEFLQRPRMSRIYWNGKFLDYPLQRPGRDQEARPGRADALPASPTCGPRSSRRATRTTSRSGSPTASASASTTTSSSPTPRRSGACPHRAPRRVGRPADQGPVVLQRRQGRVLRQQGQQGQVADLRVPLPALRPRPDVGDDDRRDHRRARRRGPARTRRSRSSRSTDGRVVARRTPAASVIEPRAGHLVAAAARRPSASRGPHRRPPRSRGGARACATATS